MIYDYANYQAVICHAKTASSPWIAKRKKLQHEYHTLLTLKDKISNQYQEIVNTYKIRSSEYSRLKDTYNYLNEQVERLDDTNKDFIIILGHRIK